MGARVAVVDVLGTVLDERGGFRTAVASVGHPHALADRWLDRVDVLVPAIASQDAPWRSWEDVVDQALAEVAPDLHRRHGDELRTVGRRLPAWPDSRAGIDALRDGCRVVALSNAGLVPLVDSSRAAGITWDAVLSAGMVGSAKPDPRVYRFALDQFGLDPGEVLMVAAHPWDLRAAAALGMRTAYVARPGEGEIDDADQFDHTAADLVELAAALSP